MIHLTTSNFDKKVTLVIKLNRQLQFLNRWIEENKNSPLQKFEAFNVQYNNAILLSEIKTNVLYNLNVLNY